MLTPIPTLLFPGPLVTDTPFKEIEPLAVKLPAVKLPVIVWLPLNEFEPVVAKLPVLIAVIVLPLSVKLPVRDVLPLTFNEPSTYVLEPESIKNPVFLVVDVPVPTAKTVGPDIALLPSCAFHLPKNAEPKSLLAVAPATLLFEPVTINPPPIIADEFRDELSPFRTNPIVEYPPIRLLDAPLGETPTNVVSLPDAFNIVDEPKMVLLVKLTPAFEFTVVGKYELFIVVGPAVVLFTNEIDELSQFIEI